MCLDWREVQGHPEGGSHHRKMCTFFSNPASVNKSLRVLVQGGLSPVHSCVMLVDCPNSEKTKENILLFKLLFQINFNDEFKQQQQQKGVTCKERINMHEDYEAQ
jgi:hypothetical protein